VLFLVFILHVFLAVSPFLSLHSTLVILDEVLVTYHLVPSKQKSKDYFFPNEGRCFMFVVIITSLTYSPSKLTGMNPFYFEQ
jgi:hypothetical protein